MALLAPRSCQQQGLQAGCGAWQGHGYAARMGACLVPINALGWALALALEFDLSPGAQQRLPKRVISTRTTL